MGHVKWTSFETEASEAHLKKIYWTSKKILKKKSHRLVKYGGCISYKNKVTVLWKIHRVTDVVQVSDDRWTKSVAQ